MIGRTAALAIAVLLLAGGGIVHGLYSDRWGTSETLNHAIARVPLVPLQVGDWMGEVHESSAEEFDQAGALAYWTRTYRKEGKEILVILMAGRAGRMSIHTPEVCYRGAGYEIYGKPSQHVARGVENSELGNFWSANFLRSGPNASEQQLYWSWNAGSGWKAPTNPRWEFAGQPALYKLYVSQSVVGGSSANSLASAKVMADFLKQFVPAANAALLGKAEKS